MSREESAAQERLREAAAARIRAARPELADAHDLTSAEGLIAVRARIAEEAAAPEHLAAVVVGRFDLASWARATCEFALGLGPEQAAAWRRSFTRTVFLAGNPDNLRERFSFAHFADDGSAAWTGPGPAADSAGLRRLLKLFDGPRPLPVRADTVVEVPPRAGRRPDRPPVHRELHIAASGCRVSDALVHLNHLLAEAVLDGLIRPGDTLTIRHVPRLTGLTDHFAALRVDTDPTLPGRLRAAAGLTEEALLVPHHRP
ncbi:DUF6182 family protein [Streptomyces melanogenes]|uniref:DUF6182 family protein n=1 Tax=Streptomyces melanogenes TaxID=67326 RepID=UPI00167D59FA|nr:DUF6182 family protein [Streptomyces melanogenes]GGP66855.1 hypothetical protein GCM10010278_50200 [Streptomyces melanogenes]